jgi:hypothetical protein
MTSSVSYYLLSIVYYLVSYSLSPDTVKHILILEEDEKIMRLIPQFFRIFHGVKFTRGFCLKDPVGSLQPGPYPPSQLQKWILPD